MTTLESHPINVLRKDDKSASDARNSAVQYLPDGEQDTVVPATSLNGLLRTDHDRQGSSSVLSPVGHTEPVGDQTSHAPGEHLKDDHG